MKDYLREPVAPQKPCQSLLVFDQPRRSARSRKGRCEVEVEAGIDFMFPRRTCCTLGILHKDHRTNRRDGPTANAVEGLVSCGLVPPPVISIDDENTAAGALATKIIVHKEFDFIHILG